jgi:uncharacterized phage-like protein YoqJ
MNNKKTTCCFSGHRKIENIQQYRPIVEDLIERLVINGYTDFVCGGAKGWDTFAAKIVLSEQEKFNWINLHLILPVPPAKQTYNYSPQEKADYDYNLKHAAEVKILSPHYYNGCMLKRNKVMAEMSSFCIAFYTSYKSGTFQTVKLVESCGGKVENAAKLYRVGGEKNNAEQLRLW